MSYEKLLNEAMYYEVDTYEKPMTKRIKGLYAENNIWINRDISTREKHCVLAEELGHYHTTQGNITDQSFLSNRKQEKQARSWAYKKVVPLSKIIEAYEFGTSNSYEMAEYLEVTETFLQKALDRYKEEYGIYKKHGNYVIYFEPLAVMHMFDE